MSQVSLRGGGCSATNHPPTNPTTPNQPPSLPFAAGRSAGASIRLAETKRLFQAAAATLADWSPEVHACVGLHRSGGARAWNELYSARSPPPPLDRRDPRWRGVGLGVRRPRLADVERVWGELAHGAVQHAAAAGE